MAGYLDTRQLIINTLTNRPAGTEIQPEDHQAFALQITDYIRAVELVAGNATPIGFAEASTVPVEPENGQAVYLSQVNRGTSVTFTYFLNENNQPITVSADTSTVKFVTLLWNGSYWSVQTTSVSATVLTAETLRVTITESSGSYSTSDSSSVIKTAFDAGKYVYAVLGTELLPLIECASSSSAIFQGETKRIEVASSAVTVISANNYYLNVNILKSSAGQPHAAYTSVASARADVPLAYRKVGLEITYLFEDSTTHETKWLKDQYIGSDISGWGTTSNWQVIGPVSISQNTGTGHIDISVGDVTIPVASTDDIKKIEGEQISVQSSNGTAVRIDWSFEVGDILMVKVSSVATRCMVLRNGSYETSNRLADTNVILGSVHITEANKWYNVIITNNIDYITVVNNGETPVTFNIRKCGEIEKKAYEVGNDVKSSITVNVDSSTGGNALSVDGNKKGEFADNSKLIKLVGISSTAAGSGVSKAGDVFFNTTSNLLRRCKVWNGVAQDSTYETVPFYEGAIYTYNDKLYIWDGANLVNKTPESTDEVEYSEKLLQSKAVYGDIMSLRSVIISKTYQNMSLAYDCSNVQYFRHGAVSGSGIRVNDTWNANDWMYEEVTGFRESSVAENQKLLLCLDIDIQSVVYNGSEVTKPALIVYLRKESSSVIGSKLNTFEIGRKKYFIEIDATSAGSIYYLHLQYNSKSAADNDGMDIVYYGIGLYKIENDQDKQIIIDSFTNNSKQSAVISSYVKGLKGKTQNIQYTGVNLYSDANCLSTSYITGIGDKSIIPGGGISFNKTQDTDSQSWLTMVFNETAFVGNTLVAGHKYLVALDMQLDSLTIGGQSIETNIQFTTSFRKESDNNYVARANTPTFDVGVRNLLYYVLTPSENVTGFWSGFEYPTKMSLAGDGMAGKIYNVLFLDITDITTSYALLLIDKYGFLQTYNDELSLLIADYAKSSIDNKAFSFWGDSLMNGSYPQMVAEHFGKDYVKNNWGGQVSSTIRDKFIERATNYPEELNNTHIFCIGRNNYTRPQDVVRDLKIMVSYLPHNRYIVMMPPNGNYTGEYKGESNYHYFTELADALQKAFGNAFCDWREELINMYNYGGVKLLASFTQPAINSNVQINVSDANFLNFSNSYFPAGQVGYIRIGNMYDETMNKYQVISIDDSTHITIKAVEADWKSAGNTIANHHYTGNGADSYGYLDIILEADYQTWIGDNTPASLRSDNIHMESVSSQEFCAMLVERELSTRGLGF